MALLHKAVFSSLDLQDGLGPQKLDTDKLAVLHINHMLRGADADEDEAFVREFCEQLNIRCLSKRLPVCELMQQEGESNFEAYARRLRYQEAQKLLEELCKTKGLPLSAGAILSAHTLDDRVETAFMKLIEGASLTGISSLRALRGNIIRPLLYETKEQLRNYLLEHKISWREDATNADIRYFRSFVRHKIVPLAAQRNPEFLQVMSTSLDVLQAEDEFLQQEAQKAFEDLVIERSTGLLVLESGRLAHTHPALARRLALLALKQLAPEQRFESQHIFAVVQASYTKPFSRSLPGDIEVRREFDDLVIRKMDISRPKLEQGLLRVPGALSLPKQLHSLDLELRARIIEVPLGASAISLARSLSVAHESMPEFKPLVFDADAAGLTEGDLREGKARLYIRAAKKGDSIEPLGMQGTKKVFDLLCEARIPLRKRSLMPVVLQADPLEQTGGELAEGKIIAIAGVRLDKAFACGKKSSRLVELSFQANTLR